MTVLHYIVFLIFPVSMAFAAASDVMTMTISNKLILVLLAGFAVAAPLSGMSLNLFGLHLAAGGVILAIAFGCFAMGWVGGGDAKLAAVIALWLGPMHALTFIVLASIAGGVLTMGLLRFRRQMLPAFAYSQEWIVRLHDNKSGVPYGIALAAAALILYPRTMWMQLALG